MVSEITDIELSLELKENEEDTLAYNYIIEYRLIDTNNIYHKIKDSGQLVLKKDTDGIFKIETDRTNYDKVFIY